MNVNCRIFAADVTCPKLNELICVLTLEYWTVFSAFVAVIRASTLRVSPIGTVLESDPLICNVPGSTIEFLEASP